MKFRKIQPYGPDSYDYWVSGIYKIVSYYVGSYHAYFIRERFDNWGDYVSDPPDRDTGISGGICWRTLRAAKAACSKHAKNYTPSPATAKRAAEITQGFLEEQELHAA